MATTQSDKSFTFYDGETFNLHQIVRQYLPGNVPTTAQIIKIEGGVFTLRYRVGGDTVQMFGDNFRRSLKPAERRPIEQLNNGW